MASDVFNRQRPPHETPEHARARFATAVGGSHEAYSEHRAPVDIFAGDGASLERRTEYALERWDERTEQRCYIPVDNPVAGEIELQWVLEAQREHSLAGTGEEYRHYRFRLVHREIIESPWKEII